MRRFYPPPPRPASTPYERAGGQAVASVGARVGAGRDLRQAVRAMTEDKAVDREPVDEEPFSVQLERWLSTDEHKTLGDLERVFGEKTFAVLVLVLMFVPAL